MADSIPEPPGDDHVYGRRPGDWEAVMPLLGGTMRGPLHLWNSTPTYPQEAASKEYVDRANGGGRVKMASYKYMEIHSFPANTVTPVEFPHGPCDAMQFTLATASPVTIKLTWNDGSTSAWQVGTGGLLTGTLYQLSCKAILLSQTNGSSSVTLFYYDIPADR